jgi:hypothetical protein
MNLTDVFQTDVCCRSFSSVVKRAHAGGNLGRRVGGFPAARLSLSRVDWLAQPICQIWHKIVMAVMAMLLSWLG